MATLTDTAPPGSWWQNLLGALGLRKEEVRAKVPAPVPIQNLPVPKVPGVELETPPKLPSYGKATSNALMSVKMVDPDEIAPFERRARAYVRLKARERGQKEVFVGEYEEGIVAIFCDSPLDCYYVRDPQPGGHCHPLYGVTIEKLRAKPAVAMTNIAV